MPASHAYPPYIEGIIFDATGKPAAGGTVEAYVAGSSVPAALWSTSDPATSLGPVVTIDGAGRAAFRLREGYAYKLRAKDKDGALIWERDNVKCPLDGGGVNIPNPMESTGDMIVGGVGGQPERLAPGNEGEVLKVVSGVPAWATDAEGMQNPMTTKGDLIVGYTDGEPDRLGVGNDGDILGSWSFAGSVQPKWEAGPKKYRNVYGDIPSPSIDDGYLGCLFYLSAAGQTLDLPSAATIPSKSFIDFVCLNDTATLTITPQGTTNLNEQSTAVTIGGKSATFYRLAFLGHGVSGDEWALGGSVLPDGKVKVDGADTSPDYLAAKLSAGSGIALTNTGSAVEIAATAQSGDHQLLVSATDAAAGYLGAKLTAGSNITITPQTDGDGVQTLEISSTGGGGGGGSIDVMTSTISQALCETWGTNLANKSVLVRIIPEFDMIPTAVRWMQNSQMDGTKLICSKIYKSVSGVGKAEIWSSGASAVAAADYITDDGVVLPLQKVTTYEDVPVLKRGMRYYVAWWTNATNYYRCHTNNLSQHNCFYSTTALASMPVFLGETFLAEYPALDVFGTTP